MTKHIAILALLLLIASGSWAIDFRSTAVTWTFDGVDTLTKQDLVQNFGGLYYQGGKGSSLKRLGSTASGTFGDGTTWSTAKVLSLAGTGFSAAKLDGKRRMAGGYNSVYARMLAFNVSVPGTCYVALRCPNKVSNASRTFNIHFQYRGFESRWTHETASLPVTTELTELKLEAHGPGTFYINPQQSAYIYAVRFVPNGDDELHIVKTAQRPGSLVRTDSGTLMADFGRDAYGQIELTLTGGKGDTVTVHLGECVAGGHVSRTPGGSRRYEAIRIPLDGGTRTYRPTMPSTGRNEGAAAVHVPMEIGGVMPFRYAEIEGYKGTPQAGDVVRLAVNYRFNDDAASFTSDNETLNQVWDLCKYSIKATSFTGYYIDGDRERTPYEADAIINQLGHYATDCEYTMTRRTFDWLMRNPTWPTEWILQMPIMAWNYYLYTGDKRLLEKYAGRLRPHTLMSLRNDSTGLISTTLMEQTDSFLLGINRSDKIKDIVDWPMKTEGDGFVKKDYNAVVNAYHYEAVSLMAKIYAALGKTDSQREMEAYAREFKAIFNNAFLDTTRGVYRDGVGTDHSSLHANMFALAFGLVPDGYRKSVTDFIVSRGMACSVYGSQFLLDALYTGNAGDAALKLLTSTAKRSWWNMIREGSTITMEAWDNQFKSNQDWNHAWGAAPANIIPFRLMGIRPTSPGFARAEIRPQTGSLGMAECKVPTIKGSITASMRHDGGQYALCVSLPEGVAADVYLPKPVAGGYAVYMDGGVVANVTETDGYVHLDDAVEGVHKIVIKKAAATTVRAIGGSNTQDAIHSLAAYNLNGQRASSTCKGLLVMNGRVYDNTKQTQKL